MSKSIKLVTTLITIIVILGIILFTYAFFDSRNNNQTVTQSIRNLFPVANEANPDVGAGDPTPDPGGSDVVGVVPNNPNKFIQISSDPVSGGMFSSTSSVRYIEKDTGNVYEYSYFTDTARKITNTTIPKIHDVYWIDKDTFVARYLAGDRSTIKSFVGSIVNSGELGTVSTTFLQDNITHITLADGNVFYIADVFPGSSGFIYNPVSNKTSRIFTSDISELTPLWHNGSPYVYTNPSNGVSGTLFGITKNGLIEVLTNIPGMLASSLNDQLLISSFTQRGNTFTYKVQGNESEGYRSILVPEKCVEVSEELYCALDSVPGNFPDNWYRGEIQFEDNFYKIEKDRGRVLVYSFFEEVPGGFDVVNISISPDGEQILFMNKRDNSLWSLDLSQN